MKIQKLTVEAIWANGDFIASVDYMTHAINLYAWCNQLVEVFFNKELSAVEMVRVADNEALTKYLKDIRVNVG